MLYIATSLTVALPLSISLFSQEMSIPREKLEEGFGKMRDEKGEEIRSFIVNKGL